MSKTWIQKCAKSEFDWELDPEDYTETQPWGCEHGRILNKPSDSRACTFGCIEKLKEEKQKLYKVHHKQVQSARQRDRTCLSQKNRRESFFQTWSNLSPNKFVEVYLDHESYKGLFGNEGVYAVLVPNKQIETCLESEKWDFHIDWSTKPSWEDDKTYKGYQRWHAIPSDIEIEPLVLYRSFGEIKKSYLEVVEEFRLFHNLYEDRRQERYVKIDETGNEECVVKIESDSVKIRWKELNQFLIAKKMFLLIQFDFKVWSKFNLKTLEIKENEESKKDQICFWNLSIFSCSPTRHYPKSMSRFYGKLLVPFDIEMNQRTNSSPDVPSKSHKYDRRVLDKYYQQPDKYSITYGSYPKIECLGLWSRHFSFVDSTYAGGEKVVELCDLGNRAPIPPTEEWKHWKKYIVTDGQPRIKIKTEYYNESLVPLFKKLYLEVKYEYEGILFQPLSQQESDLLDQLKCPTVNREEFNFLITALTILLIESIKEKEERTGGTKGKIKWIKETITSVTNIDPTQYVEILYEIYEIRNKKGVAHRNESKRENYLKEKELGDKSIQIFRKINDFLEFLISTR